MPPEQQNLEGGGAFLVHRTPLLWGKSLASNISKTFCPDHFKWHELTQFSLASLVNLLLLAYLLFLKNSILLFT